MNRIELIPRKGSSARYPTEKDPNLASEGCLFSSIVAGGPLSKSNSHLVNGGVHLRKGCKIIKINQENVEKLPFENILKKLLGKYPSERAVREWSTVDDIFIPPSSFKPVLLPLSRIFSILKHPKQVFFLTQ